jgi:hypothetical protein
VNKCAPLLALLLTGCAVSTAVDSSPHLVSAMSFAQPAVVRPPSGFVSVVDWSAFAWNDPNSPLVASYNLYYGSLFPHEYDQLVTTTNLSAVVSNMVPGTSYHLAITAVSLDGTESDFSPEYDYVMPMMVEMGFAFNSPVTNVLVQSSADLMNWQLSDARPRTNGLWRITVDGEAPGKFYRGIGQAVPAL